jgi:hypothetical protein
MKRLKTVKLFINYLKLIFMNRPMLDRYRNSEYLQYMKDVLELVNLQDVDTLQLTTQRDALQTVTSQMDNLFQQEKGSGITQELIELDTRRDRAFMGIKATLEATQYHYDEAMQSAGRSLLYSLNTFGTNIPRLNYQAETAVIDSMLSDWSTETDLAAAVTTLRITDWIAELTTANDLFNDRYLARISEAAANPAVSFTIIRDGATTMYRVLVAHIEAHATLGTNATHQSLVDEVSELARQYNQMVDFRMNTSSEEAPLPNTDTESLGVDAESSSTSDSASGGEGEE